MEYRIATEQDIPVMCRIRKQQLIDEGLRPCMDIDEELRSYFAGKLADGSLVEWLAEEDGQVVATAAIAFMEFPPTYTNRTGIRGYITNMYTAPEYRGKGIASAMLEKLTDEAGKRGVTRVWLHASALGEPVYRRIGFAKTDRFMELDLGGAEESNEI